jgi:hypothetical protein
MTRDWKVSQNSHEDKNHRIRRRTAASALPSGLHCLACIDRLPPSLTKSLISYRVLKNVVDPRRREWELILVIVVVVVLAVSYLFIGRGYEPPKADGAKKANDEIY